MQAPAVGPSDNVSLGKTKSGRITKGPKAATSAPKKAAEKKKVATPKKKATPKKAEAAAATS